MMVFFDDVQESCKLFASEFSTCKKTKRGHRKLFTSFWRPSTERICTAVLWSTGMFNLCFKIIFMLMKSLVTIFLMANFYLHFLCRNLNYVFLAFLLFFFCRWHTFVIGWKIVLTNCTSLRVMDALSFNGSTLLSDWNISM